MNPILILGTGLAGYTVAREFRKLDRTSPLALLTRDRGGFYSKPMLSNAIAQGKEANALVTQTAEQMATQLDATVRVGVEVTSIDPVAHSVRLSTGETIAYSKLVLSPGADPIRIPLAGDAASDVLSVNDVEDYARFRDAIRGRRRVAVIGAGLIGCEFANDLAGGGFEVDVIDLAPAPLGRLAPREASEYVRKKLAEIGVRFHFGRAPRSVDRTDNAIAVTLEDGTRVAADVVLSAVGLRPRVALADAAGLAVNRAIVVDRYLATSSADVYALGDAAEVDALVLPYVMPIMQAARALAKTLAGEPTAVTYPAMPVVVKTPAAPLVVSPIARGEARWECTASPEGVRAECFDAAGQLAGFALAGAAVAEKQALTKRLPAWLTAETAPA
jgi:rubredoxin-NAD+ reductase